MKAGMLALVILLTLMITQSAAFVPAAGAGGPGVVLGIVSGTLNPGAVTTGNWQLNEDVPGFLFYYNITGGSQAGNAVSVTIDDLLWQSLMGEGWDYCDCVLNAGSYDVTAQADTSATGPVHFEIGFYVVPQSPVDFSGRIPANSNTRFSDFAVLLPGGTHTLVLGVTSGTYDLFVDNDTSPRAVVTKTTDLTVDLQEGLHLFNVTAGGVGTDVGWSVQIQGEPKLEPRIVIACQPINQSNPVCVTGVDVTASDGRSPNVTYAWTDNGAGGSFNSTSGKWVKWTPSTVGVFGLTVQVFAAGYSSDSDSLSVEVTEAVPEFSSTALVLIFTLALMVVLLARRSRGDLASAPVLAG